MDEQIFEAPCMFCGYNGEGYWQKGTHDGKCPWYHKGGESERQAHFPKVIAYLYDCWLKSLSESHE